MSEKHEKDFEDFMCKVMSAYKLIPLLACLTVFDEKEITEFLAWTSLRRLILKKFSDMPIHVSEDLLSKFVEKNRSWILYALADMSYYAEDFFFNKSNRAMEDCRFEHYLGMMENQAYFIKHKPETFQVRCGGDIRILDIGCGPFPYFELFRKANPRLIEYYGIDKRDMYVHATALNARCKDVFVDFYPQDASEFPYKCGIPPHNVLFLGNFLHCLSNTSMIIDVVATLLESGNTKEVLIMEPNLDEEGLGTAFEFHMIKHGGIPVNRMTIKGLADCLNRNVEIRAENNQYIMYALI